MTILLVDDDLFICAYLQHVLRSRGHHVVDCDNGVQALERVQILRFDLAVVDMMMPEMGGAELIGKLRERHPGLAIIGISGGCNLGDVNALSPLEQLRLAGADCVLEKPFEEKDFINAITESVAKHQPFHIQK